MFQSFLEEIKTELISGSLKKGHPFRNFTLGTVSATNDPILRTVVLRKVNADLELFFFTDSRSNKMDNFLLNEGASALFYDSEKMIQLQVRGYASIERDPETLNSFWDNVPLSSRKDYTTSLAPGTIIKNPNQVEYLLEKQHFSVVKIVPSILEYLCLKKPNHLRIRFAKENENWNGQFLVP